MPKQVERPQRDYQTERYDATPLPDEPSGDPTSLSGVGGGMFSEMRNAARLFLALAPLAVLGGLGLKHWATGLVENSAERKGVENAVYYDDQALDSLREKLMQDRKEIIDSKTTFSQLENPSTRQIADFEKTFREREAKWIRRARSYNEFRASVIKQAKKIGESEENFAKEIKLDLESDAG